MLRVLWEYEVRSENRREFEEAYGGGGPWVALFATSPGYLGTELLRDPTVPGRYLTIDSWSTRGAGRSFTVRLTPSMHTEPLRAMYFDSDAGTSKSMRNERASFARRATVAVPST